MLLCRSSVREDLTSVFSIEAPGFLLWFMSQIKFFSFLEENLQVQEKQTTLQIIQYCHHIKIINARPFYDLIDLMGQIIYFCCEILLWYNWLKYCAVNYRTELIFNHSECCNAGRLVSESSLPVPWAMSGVPWSQQIQRDRQLIRKDRRYADSTGTDNTLWYHRKVRCFFEVKELRLFGGCSGFGAPPPIHQDISEAGDLGWLKRQNEAENSVWQEMAPQVREPSFKLCLAGYFKYRLLKHPMLADADVKG